MKVVIERKNNEISESFAELIKILPQDIAGQVREYINVHGIDSLNEIRLRANKKASITADGKNFVINTVCSLREIGDTVTALCDGSVYAHSDTICDGYVTFRGGYRAGISGCAAVDRGQIIGIRDVTSINIRIPHNIPGAGKEIYNLLKDNDFSCGILIYSAPGIGKTTILRQLCRMLSSGENPLRTAAVDTRRELEFGCDNEEITTLDLLSGYPRAKGIEIAARTMNAQIIVCDEIGSRAEAEAILDAQNTGVPLIASAHSSSFESLMNRTYIKTLCDAGVFNYVIGISRSFGSTVYKYEITEI